jgi:hypothetical protein
VTGWAVYKVTIPPELDRAGRNEAGNAHRPVIVNLRPPTLHRSKQAIALARELLTVHTEVAEWQLRFD